MSKIEKEEGIELLRALDNDLCGTFVSKAPVFLWM